MGTVSLVQAALAEGCETVVHAGSSSEYGFKDHPPSEDDVLEPNSVYAASKCASTLYCRQTANATGARVVTVRLYSVYGPWEEPRRLIPTLIEHGLAGGLPPLTVPTTARDFVYVDDVVEAMALAAEHARPGAVYNVGSGRQSTLAELVDLAKAELAIVAEPRWGTEPARTWDTSLWVADPRLIREDLGWSARTSLAEGFRRTVEWQRARGSSIGRR
jgi:dolichol-phosphate mannosyltransferase